MALCGRSAPSRTTTCLPAKLLHRRHDGQITFALSESCQALPVKIFYFRFSELCDYLPPSRLRQEGRIAIATDVGSGERWTRWCREASGIEADERNRAVLISRR